MLALLLSAIGLTSVITAVGLKFYMAGRRPRSINQVGEFVLPLPDDPRWDGYNRHFHMLVKGAEVDVRWDGGGDYRVTVDDVSIWDLVPVRQRRRYVRAVLDAQNARAQLAERERVQKALDKLHDA